MQHLGYRIQAHTNEETEQKHFYQQSQLDYATQICTKDKFARTNKAKTAEKAKLRYAKEEIHLSCEGEEQGRYLLQ